MYPLLFHVINYECLVKHAWLADVYRYFQEGQITAGDFIVVVRWVLDNLCMQNV